MFSCLHQVEELDLDYQRLPHSKYWPCIWFSVPFPTTFSILWITRTYSRPWDHTENLVSYEKQISLTLSLFTFHILHSLSKNCHHPMNSNVWDVQAVWESKSSKYQFNSLQKRIECFFSSKSIENLINYVCHEIQIWDMNLGELI